MIDDTRERRSEPAGAGSGGSGAEMDPTAPPPPDEESDQGGPAPSGLPVDAETYRRLKERAKRETRKRDVPAQADESAGDEEDGRDR